MCPLRRDLTSSEGTAPPALSPIAPSLEDTLHPICHFYIWHFYVLEVHKHVNLEESQMVGLHFQSDYFFGSHLLALGVLAASKKCGSLLARPWGRFWEIAQGLSSGMLNKCWLLSCNCLQIHRSLGSSFPGVICVYSVP